LKPLGLTANALAKAIGVPPNRITAILKDERGITGDTAIRPGTFFKTSAEFWMNLQMAYDLRNAEKALPAGSEKEYRKQQDRALTLNTLVTPTKNPKCLNARPDPDALCNISRSLLTPWNSCIYN
jgi:addiction module HigA family antidote